MNAASLRVELDGRGYEIRIAAGILATADQYLADILAPRPLVVVTDSNLARTDHPARLAAALGRLGIECRPVVVEAGEGSKRLEPFGQLLESILETGIDRRTPIVALGGGVVGDLGGFAAAVLLRGLPFIQVPTSLLAMVDSSVGGKTGVNSRLGKNLIGAFHQPRRVLIDTACLDGLPERELRCGYAELVKHAFIGDRELFDWLEVNAPALFAGDPDVRREAIARSVAIKAAIVAADEHETSGLRALLNFGHTFGHAYEAAAGYGAGMLHGEAVALGMTSALRLSERLGCCPGQEAGRMRAHLRTAGLPIEWPLGAGPRPSTETLLAIMRRDKKAIDDRMVFVLSRGIGEAFVAGDVPVEAVVAALEHDV